MPAKFRMEQVTEGFWWRVAYVNGRRYVLHIIGRVGDCLRP